MPATIFISAGEASGEHYGALLVSALKNQLAAVGETSAFLGMGGPRMAAAGLERIVRAEDMAVMGLTEVLRHLPRIYGEFRKLKKAIRTRKPDVAVLIDFPDLHFRLAKEFHRQGIPVIFFVSPQLWAWKKHRIKLVQKYISKMLVIFPFEEQFYRDHGVEAEFVGHPLAELPTPSISRGTFALENGLNPESAWVGLLPGSRPREISDLLPEMLAAAQMLAARHADLGFLIPLAPTLNPVQRQDVRQLVQQHGAGLTVHLVEDARAVLWHARGSVVASGTATVEAALLGNPFVVVYRVSPVTYAIAKRIVKVPHIAMANLIANRRIVPELIQNDFTAENIVQQIEPILEEGAARQSMKKELQAVRDGLHGTTGAIERVAAITLEVRQKSSRSIESV